MTASTPGAPAAPTIEIHNLHKSFGSTKALDGLDLTVSPGEVAGFLGPNGAGKSTTIRVLLGLLRADLGSARLFGSDVWDDAVALHRRLAYVPGDVSLWPNLTGGEVIDYLTRLRGHGRDSAATAARKRELLAKFELDPTKKARTYSKGNRQKVALVASLCLDAELYIFDEPTSGLDPLMEAVFTDEVRRIKAAGRSVLLSSHILSEVEKVCDTVTIIRAGRAVESGTLDALRHLTRSNVTAVLDGEPGAVEQAVAAIPGVHDLATTANGVGTRVTFDVDQAAMGPVLRTLGGLGVHSFSAAPPSLEDLFMRHYGDELAALEGTGTPAGAR
ncbi:ABC transporter ATP-binding protein [Xylanimonas allomyrinae]|uniref:ABC transporter ATP-binding protein n=1 Tax=Xylanimonas allomyrinae TaxID=2509459 RepID=A0A4P6EQG4_9MICO|nr:ABC transporter ATP-binding protein [Xylanimonas allomyrinae]QAY64083.1 ABC transporter ATP-binding protein [Xylanimonas allomyrinae]